MLNPNTEDSVRPNWGSKYRGVESNTVKCEIQIQHTEHPVCFCTVSSKPNSFFYIFSLQLLSHTFFIIYRTELDPSPKNTHNVMAYIYFTYQSNYR